MKRYVIATGTVTYAIKGRDILRRHGFSARVERRTANLSHAGCGYAVVVQGDISKAEDILRESGVKILGIEEAD